MSWHKEFLSENNKKKSLSTMGELFSLIEEVYEVEKGRLFKSSKDPIALLREQFLNERKSMTLTLDAIPEIAKLKNTAKLIKPDAIIFLNTIIPPCIKNLY
mgnify:CR=1 FL=1